MKFYLGFFVITALAIFCNAFQIPSFEDVRQSWGNLVGSKKPVKKQRAKRSYQRSTGTGDESSTPTEAQTSTLPMKNGKINLRYMPTLGNGHLGATVYSDAVYLNGLFNGAGDKSHRAKIPALTMSRAKLREDNEKTAQRKFNFDSRTGVFTEKIECDFANIEHKIYVHAKYIRLLVSTIKMTKRQITGSSSSGKITFTYPQVNSTNDLSLVSKRSVDGGSLRYIMKTKEAEQDGKTNEVSIYMNDPINDLSIGFRKVEYAAVLMAVDKDGSAAYNEFKKGMLLMERGFEKEQDFLLEEHIEHWKKIWDAGRLEVEGDLIISKLVNFAQYYIYSSLPPVYAHQRPSREDVYLGMSRVGSAWGGANDPYKGHVMWDSEMYIIPSVVLFHPEHVKHMLWYRGHVSANAKVAAEADGITKGNKYPWRSGTSGKDVTPNCPDCANRLYVNGAIAFAVRTFFSATRDRDYITNLEYKGCDLMIESARYLAEKALYDPKKGRYVINEVTGPDEYHKNINNNAFTNVLASLAIHYARYFACQCEKPEAEIIPETYIQKALYMYLPFDISRRLHYQFEGFQDRPPSERVSQADTIMLGYPLNWNMSMDIYRNDLEYYETKTDQSTSALTWSFFTVGWKWIEETSKAKSFFLKSYQDFVVQPFKVWTEYGDHSNVQNEGAVNFLPGMGGFLQSIIFGFAGVRIRPEMLEFHNPIPAPDTDKIKLLGFTYLGAKMDIEITEDRVIIKVKSLGLYPLKLKRNNTEGREEELERGKTIEIDEQDKAKGFYIFSPEGTGCEHPRDYVYMPWGYSPFINSANIVRISPFYIIILVAALIMKIT
ncbi:DgyrCDS3529 [Dimorphilus gyrociliatus]|uniref:Protein-glucosylgalactosylhydroxylysine glucosidase n=1 Tax=Dimorphilus gyrociliatus TaxID=2664684 RepID=A0A7I8VE18_9ANNE|nr:DgyrCDS3529 [Dimorphilus gyrociliatus]